MVSTTNVSPSHFPVENPFHDGSGSLGNGRPSAKSCRYVTSRSDRMTTRPGSWMNFLGGGKVRMPFLHQVRCPRLIRQAALEPCAKIQELRCGRIVVAAVWRAPRLELPDSGEVRFAIGGSWSRRGEVWLAIRQAGNSSGRIIQPLRVGRHARHECHADDHAPAIHKVRPIQTALLTWRRRLSEDIACRLL